MPPTTQRREFANATIERAMISRPVVAGLTIDLQKIPENFIGDQLATPFQVDAEAFDYPIFGNEGLEAGDDDLRGLDAEFKEVKIAESFGAAEIDEHGLKSRLDRRRIRASRRADQLSGAAGANSGENRLKARTSAVLRMKVLRRREIIISNLATAPANYSGVANAVGSHKFNNINLATDVDIRAKVDALKITIMGDSGFEPNIGLLGRTARFQLGQNPAVIDAMPADASKVPSLEFLQEFFSFPKLILGTALSKRTAKAKALPIYDDVFWMGYVDPTPNSETLTWARTFWMPWENGLEADVNEIEIGNERFVMMSYAQMYRPTIVGKDCAGLIYDTDQNGI